MTLRKIDIIESVYSHLGIPKKDCVSIVESLFDNQGLGTGKGLY